MKNLLKEIIFLLNSIPNHKYTYNDTDTETYVLVKKVEDALERLNKQGGKK